MTRINIELDESLHKRAKINALLQNKTLIVYLSEALDRKVKRSEGKK